MLAPQGAAVDRATCFLCYDELDPNAYLGGGIAFHAVGHAALWEHCRMKKLRVLADVHTHPGHNVRQSPTDQRNPMLPLHGHTAIIVPNFANTSWWTLNAVGVYEYLGDFQWRSYAAGCGKRRVTLGL